MIFSNLIWVDTADETENTKVVSELKDLFIFWSISTKSINLSMLFLLFFELKTFNSRKTLLMSIMTITVL